MSFAAKRIGAPKWAVIDGYCFPPEYSERVQRIPASDPGTSRFAPGCRRHLLGPTYALVRRTFQELTSNFVDAPAKTAAPAPCHPGWFSPTATYENSD